MIYACVVTGLNSFALLRWPWHRKQRRYRSIPGVPKQFKLLLRRAGVKWIRGWSYKFIDMLLFAGAALVVGEAGYIELLHVQISSSF